jgi:hypothetical protein
MPMALLFTAITVAFAGIALAAALAGVWVVAVAAGALGAWMSTLAWTAVRKTRR